MASARFFPRILTDRPSDIMSVNVNDRNLSLLLKPSRGRFENFVLGQDLHIGIFEPTTGLVTSLCRHGIVQEPFEASWMHAVPVLVLPRGTATSAVIRSFLKKSLMRNGHFNAMTYCPTSWNCFDFVLVFLREYFPFPSTFHAVSKKEFVARHVYPVVKHRLD